MEHTEPDTVYYTVKEVKQLRLKLNNSLVYLEEKKEEVFDWKPGDMIIAVPLSENDPPPPIPAKMGILAIIPDRYELETMNKKKPYFYKYPGSRKKLRLKASMILAKVSGFAIPVSDIPPIKLPPID